MDESLRLLAFQQQLEKDVDGGVKFVGLSVTETIRACIVAGMPKKAERVRGDFKVPDKRCVGFSKFPGCWMADRHFLDSFWYTKLYALTETRDFDGLDTFSKSKRSPIGYEPFVAHLVSKGFLKQAALYVAKCDAKSRPDLYVKCGEWQQAGRECKERGDKSKLQ